MPAVFVFIIAIVVADIIFNAAISTGDYSPLADFFRALMPVFRK